METFSNCIYCGSMLFWYVCNWLSCAFAECLTSNTSDSESSSSESLPGSSTFFFFFLTVHILHMINTVNGRFNCQMVPVIGLILRPAAASKSAELLLNGLQWNVTCLMVWLLQRGRKTQFFPMSQSFDRKVSNFLFYF